MSYIFFKVKNGVSINQSEYIRIHEYMCKNSNNIFSLILFNPATVNKFTHLLASNGVALIPPDSNEIRKGIVIEIDSDELTINEKLSMPFFSMPEFISRVESNSTLDIGCGNKAFSNQLPGTVITVDSFDKFKPHLLWDLNNTPLPFNNDQFDNVILIDVIEHLVKDSGIKLLEDAKRITSKYVFIFTPTKWFENREATEDPTSEYYQNIDNIHRSIWEEKDFDGFKRVYNKGIENYFFGYWSK